MTSTDRETTGIDLSVIVFRNDSHFGSGFMSWAGGVFEGHIVLVCSEGVSYDVTNLTDERCKELFGMTPVQIREKLLEGNEGFTTPEELIRQFGSRLESNFDQFVWYVKGLMTGRIS